MNAKRYAIFFMLNAALLAACSTATPPARQDVIVTQTVERMQHASKARVSTGREGAEIVIWLAVFAAPLLLGLVLALWIARWVWRCLAPNFR